MGVYFKFEETDLLWTTINSSPRVLLSSGTAGWRGNVGVSSSLSLYEGIRGRTDVYPGSTSGLQIYPRDPVPTHSIDKTIYVSGSYPSTGSVNLVKVRSTPVPDLFNAAANVTSVDWYQEHFGPINQLFNYYSRVNPDYTTASLDYYSLYFGLQPGSAFTGTLVYFRNHPNIILSGNHTVELWMKPTQVAWTGSTPSALFGYQTTNGWSVFLTGSAGNFAFTDNKVNTVVFNATASLGVWQHVAIVVPSGSALSSSIYLNSVPVAGYQSTGALNISPTIQNLNDFQIGGVGVDNAIHPTINTTGFRGFIFEYRVWNSQRTQAQISASYLTTIVDSGSRTDLAMYCRFNDGPGSTNHGFSAGSGVFDYAPGATHGYIAGNDLVFPKIPMWQPNDNITFFPQKSLASGPTGSFMKAVHVPAMFYGRQIATGSVFIVDNAYSQLGHQRVLLDDGRGRLYVSGSMVRPIAGVSHAGMPWRRVGTVFYNEGLITITDPSMFDVGENLNVSSSFTNDIFQVAFSGLERTMSKVFQCRMPPAQANVSNNPSFSTTVTDPTNQFYGKQVIKQSPPVTWITAVGLYNEDRKLVAVAKLAAPIRKREKDPLLIRLRLDI